MFYRFLKSKIHGAIVTDACLEYEGSITIDTDLMEATGIRLFESVDIYNITNGNRFSTYVIEGEKGSGTIGINGAAARLAQEGDRVIIAAYAFVSEEEVERVKPRIVIVDSSNRIMKKK